jgi:autotransporter-associated beta strand protein
MNSPGTQRAVKITKWGNGRLSFYNSSGLYTGTGILNNDSKNNPSAQGDILGDWREELVLRTSDNTALHVYTTNYASDYSLYTLWHDHEYRNGMAWQCVGYNQPPHVSYFLGELEGITMAPPPLILQGRTEVANGGTIATTTDHLLVSGYENQTISVADGASPYILTVNAPSLVAGSGSQQATASTPKQPERTVTTYTTTLTGGAFSGATRLIKQGEGVLVLPNVTEKHTGETNIWQGTLQFDGTFESSPLWLNRHTTLISNGGNFKGGIKADYNATIYPGGKGNIGSVQASKLALGFGSRVVIDINGSGSDQINADEMNVEVKTWQNGPKYKAPVLQFDVVGTLTAGKYKIGTIGAVSGKLDAIVLEGVGDKRSFLNYEDGTLYLVVEDMRAAATVVWNGTTSNLVWDFGVTKNFLNNGVADYAGVGDNVIFNDDAEVASVNIKGGVQPATVTFSNNTKPYSVVGDSIIGGATITKEGNAKVTLNNAENHTGATYINGGTLEVTMLANNSGQTYGTLGDASQTINITDATLSANGVITTDQPFMVGGTATINVPTGKSLTLNNAIKGAGSTVVKAGAGSMTLGLNNTFKKLVVTAGSVSNHENGSAVIQMPDSVELQGGTLSDVANENTYSSNRTNFIVPAGKTGTFYGDPRCDYYGTLTGSGTFIVYGTWIRCRYKGNWSEFTGTVTPRLQDRSVKHGYDPEFSFCNNYGLPQATLSLESGVTIYNRDPESGTKYNVELGAVTGTGTLAGGGNYIIGSKNVNILANFKSTAPIIKRGTGYMQVSAAGNITGGLTIEQGQLRFNDTNLKESFFGSSALTIKGEGTFQGRGQLASLTMENGTEGTLSSMYSATTPGIVKVVALANVKQGATLNFVIKSAKLGSTTSPGYSQFNVKYLTLNGTVKVSLASGYTPAKGDEFTLWNVTSTFSGTPTFELPELPAGLYWDTTALAATTGVLRITDDASVGIGKIGDSEQVACDVYTAGGTFVGSFTAQRSAVRTEVKKLGVKSGLYIVRMAVGLNVNTETVVIK